jgi:arylsulfatase A-like enzyme
MISIAILILAFSGCKPERSLSGFPNIVLICMESTRADHLGCYGYDRDTSPTIDSLAAAGVLWTRCQSSSPWTLPSLATIWTGVSPKAHMTDWHDNRCHALDLSLPTIASVLSQYGYKTACIMHTTETNFVGFDKGFDHFGRNIRVDVSATAVSRAISLLEASMLPEDRFLLIIQNFEPHAPYDPQEPFRSMWTDSVSDSTLTWWTLAGDSLVDPGESALLTALYDGEIRSVDDQIDSLCCYLRDAGLADSTVIIITSDHGEEFLDHGWIGHSHSLYQELLHVPLIISGPGVPAGETRNSAAGLWDILPTITALVGAETPMNVEGMDLFSDSLPEERPIPSGALLPNIYAVDEDGKPLLLPVEAVAIVMGDLKLIWDVLADSMTMYDLAADPLETSPIEPVEEMILEAEEYMFTPPQCIPRPMPNETILTQD